MSRAYIYVDAANGNILLSDAIIKHADRNNQSILKNELDTDKIISDVKDSNLKNTTSRLATGNAATRYSGTQSIETSLNTAETDYILFDTTRGGGVRTYNAQQSTVLTGAIDFKDTDNDWTATEFDNSTFDNAALDAHYGVEKTYDYFKISTIEIVMTTTDLFLEVTFITEVMSIMLTGPDHICFTAMATDLQTSMY